MDKKKKIIVIIVVFVSLLLLILSSWFIYKTYFKDRQGDGDSKDEDTDDEDNAKIISPNILTVSGNPFESENELLKFQQWVVNVKGDKTILGKGGSTGYGDDGKWGSKSSTAWDKYKNEFYEWARTSGSPTNCPIGQVRNSVTGACESKNIKTPMTTPKFKSGDVLYQKSGKINLYEYPSSKNSSIIGYIPNTTQAIGTFISDTSLGFIKIKLDKIGYTESGLIYDSYRPVSSPPKEVYVSSNLVRK